MNSNKELMQRRSQAIPRGVGQIHPIFADRAENCRCGTLKAVSILISRAGLRCSIPAPASEGGGRGGSAVEKLSHTCFQVLAYEPYLELCEIMNQKVPAISPRKRCWLRPVPKRWKTR